MENKKQPYARPALQKGRPFEKPKLTKLTSEQAKLKLLGAATAGAPGAKTYAHCCSERTRSREASRIGRNRRTLASCFQHVASLFRKGVPEKEIAEDFPALSIRDLAHARLFSRLGGRPGRPRKRLAFRRTQDMMV